MGIFKLNGIDYMGGGGGGNTNYEELTQLEYDALTEEEKNNGTIYFITDTNSNQDGKFQPIIYSESEREIGVWTDGKPLYQKTVHFTNASTDGSVPLGLANIDTIFMVNGQYDKDTPIPYVAANGMQYAIGGFFGGLTANTNVTWEIRRGSGGVATATGFITVQYTKTTDTPGSGTWTPQGVPAMHYSTDEHVVGTWVDGSTIYEKTVDLPSVTLSGDTSSWTDVDVVSPSYGYNTIGYFIHGTYGHRIEAYLMAQKIKLIVISKQTPNIDITGYKITVRYTKSS